MLNVDQNWVQSHMNSNMTVHCEVAMQKSDLYLDLIQNRMEKIKYEMYFSHYSEKVPHELI